MRAKESEEFVSTTLNPGALEADLKLAVDGEIRFDAGSRALYSTDGSNYRQIPIGVVIPRTTEAVVKTIEICHRHGAPVVSRGGGTALCGQTCNVAVVIDHSKYLNKILEIDPDKKIARVQPGLILDHLRDETEKQHLTYGPDPATHNHNTFGGMIGNNSCGIHSVMAGRTADNIHSLEIVTYDGVRMTVGPTTEEELNDIIDAGGRRGEIYRGLRDIRDRYAELIRQRYPKIPRRVSGYNLDDLLPENGFNVARALVGSEGTCITILEATIRLVYSPPARSLLVLGYPDVFSAGDDIPDIMAFGPVGLEGLDELLVEFMKRKKLHPQDAQLLPEGNGWLLVEFGGETKEESDDKARRAMEKLKERENPPSMKLLSDPDEAAKVWEVRESGLGATANVPGIPLGWPGWEDAAVPPDKVGNYLRDFRKLLDGHGLIASLYGHFGQGCIHCRISFDLFTHEGVQNYLSFIDKASDLVVSYGGSISGEHGDGQSKAVLLKKMYGEELLEAFRHFKTLWDPEWKMNPGKVVEPYAPDENLRLGVDYNPWQPNDTVFKFPQDDGSFPRATLRCVGVGKCRRTHDAFMCPSFLATREEKHTTRGRAHLLFEMFRGDFISDGWRSKEVKEALEFCLSCKGCKTDCPVNVDMATYKAEFLHHHYRYRLRPLPAYSMGLIGIWGAVGSKVPRLANFMGQTPIIRDFTKAVGGIAQQRTMPRFAEQTFSSWFEKNKPEVTGQSRVVLYPDPFNDFFFPQALQAAFELLSHYGYCVMLPPKRLPAVRPPMDYGMLDYARREVLKAIDLLSPYVREGIPVVILEPSTAAVFRCELPEMFPQHEDGKRLTEHAMLLSEFMVREGLAPPKLSGKIVYHGHCHQKAVLDPKAAHQIFQQMGLEVDEPQKGCCGMAGSFGFERGKYELSMKIAEMNLLPAARKASPETYVVADGFSCRTQIMEGTGRDVLHMAEFLHHALMPQAVLSLARRRKGGAMTAPKKRTVVVTGASAGVGRATALAFARAGDRVALLSRNRERLEAARAEIEELGGEALILVADIADATAVEQAASVVEQEFGPIDVWVNNAMSTVFSPFMEVTTDEFKRATEVTYLGTVNGTKAALRRMVPRNSGTIIQVGSALSERSIPLQAAYCGAKHAIRGFTDSLRSELVHDKKNVHLTMVQLPAMNTPQFDWCESRLPNKPQPVPPIYQPEVAADAIVWASHRRRREVYVGMPTVEAMWGNKFIAGILDWYLGRKGYKAQQTDQPVKPNRPSNLWHSVDGNYGAHGSFDDKAKGKSAEVWFVKRKWLIGGITAACAAGAAVYAAKKGNGIAKALRA